MYSVVRSCRTALENDRGLSNFVKNIDLAVVNFDVDIMGLILKDLSLKIAENVIFESLDLQLNPKEIHVLLGPNGIGKTTLFRMITGEEKPDSGTLELGETVDLAYVDQHRDALNNENTVFQEITGRSVVHVIGKGELVREMADGTHVAIQIVPSKNLLD